MRTGRIVEAITQAAQLGTSFGAPTARESVLAEKVRALVPSMKKLRFVSSGTEATSHALRVGARIHRTRAIVKFEGLLPRRDRRAAGSRRIRSGNAGLPDSPGVPRALALLTTVLPFNDAQAVRVTSAGRSAGENRPAPSSSRWWQHGRVARSPDSRGAARGDPAGGRALHLRE